MCGIYGTIGATETQNRMLALLNEDRGRQSVGWYADGTVYHATGDVRDAILKERVPRTVLDAMLYLGHTRHATTGKVCKKNCHPFTIGNTVGAHNGIVYNFRDLQMQYKQKYPEVDGFTVDSQILLWLVDTFGPSGLKQAECYAGLWFLDRRKPGTLHLWNFDCELSYGTHNGAFLFSSDANHLKLVGVKSPKTVKDRGELLAINVGAMKITSRKTIRASKGMRFYDWRSFDVGKETDGVIGFDADCLEGREEQAASDYFCITCEDVLSFDEVIGDYNGDYTCAFCHEPVEPCDFSAEDVLEGP